MKLNNINRITALLLCMLMLLSLVACGNNEGEEVPRGYKIANCEGDDFRLYVPTSWNLNTAYGVAGAYYNFNKRSTVSAVKYPIDDAMNAAMGENTDRLGWFYENRLLPPLAASELGGTLKTEAEPSPATMGTLNAKKFFVSAIVDGATNRFLYVVAESQGAFYVLTYTAESDVYDMLLPEVDTMIQMFALAAPYQNLEPIKKIDEDAEAPEGMQLASNKDVAYLFYAPAGWKIDQMQGIFTAVAPDRSSVSVTPYMPDTAISVKEYAEKIGRDFSAIGGVTYTKIAESEGTLGEKPAIILEYTLQMEGKTYRYKQIMAAYRGMIYSLTYTAYEENYQAHLEEVDAVLAAFFFR